MHIDLSELRVDYHYTGLALRSLCGSNLYDAVARGGRCDGLGGYFDVRPAAGFGFDLRSFIGRLPLSDGIQWWCRCKDIPVAQEAVDALREQGQCVVIRLRYRLQRFGRGYRPSETSGRRLESNRF